MNLKAFLGIGFLVALAVGSSALTAAAEAPVLQSHSPVIYLADNLDEKDKLGWCIDTQGRGFAEILHSHSCKEAARGISDTQFSYDPSSGQIRSVPFEGKCMSFSDPENAVSPFGLHDCQDGEITQAFDYDAETMEIRFASDPSQCVTVAPESRAAGPYMSRNLIYGDCDSAAPRFKQWIVKD